jgi:uncharacterized damage-inducible protein DinB
MTEQMLFEMLSSYNSWSNQNLYSICDALSNDTRTKDMGAFFGSIHRTLDHILHGDRSWLERLRDDTYTPRSINDMTYPDWAQLKHERVITDQEICLWVASLDAEHLNSLFTYTSNVDSKQRSVPYWLLVHHLFNHQTHHRGQVTTLLSQLGVDFGTTDIPFMPMAQL